MGAVTYSDTFTTTGGMGRAYEQFRQAVAASVGVPAGARFRLRPGLVVLQLRSDGVWLDVSDGGIETFRDGLRCRPGNVWRLRLAQQVRAIPAGAS